MSKRKEEYLEYLQSDRWKELKEEAYKIHGRICKQCESKKNLQVHHKRYPKELGTESPKDDLIILCKKCHRKFHGYRELPRKPRPLVAGMNWQNNFKKTLDKF